MQTAFPTPEDDDAEDVAWGLTTGAALWRQGERYDAIVWLKRAVEAATDAGASGRADQLNRAATDLIASLAAPPQAAAVPKPVSPRLATPQPQPAAPAAKPPKPPPPRIPTPPATRAAAPSPAAPKPPPPPKSRLPMPTPAPVDKTLEPTPPRPPMPSVTTSAPPLEALTGTPPAAAAEVDRRDAPPPPTILPDVPPPMPTAEMPVSDLDAALVSEAPPPPSTPAPESTEVASPDDLPHEPSAIEGPPALVSALEDLPLTLEQKRVLARTATIETLADEEDVSIACLALVLEGQGAVQAAVTDVTAVTLNPGELVYARSSIPDTLSLRIVAEANPTVIALWDASADDVMGMAPELALALKRASDRTQAIAGCTMGLVGERLDEGLRALAFDRLEVRALPPNEIVAAAGQPVPGMVIVGVGTVELEREGGEIERLGPGDFLFASQVLAGGAAPTTARAGAKGAIILFGGRAVAHELLVTCPPLLEVFAGM
jgi:hypothetical protein